MSSSRKTLLKTKAKDMPNYDYKCESCGFTVLDVQLPIAARDFPTTQPCAQCNEFEVQRCLAAPGVGYTVNRGGLKTPDAFKDILRDIKKRHRKSTINV